ncbi:hypothetical protein GCM10010517_66960 [Streptosporangium fragile]|uniref:DUF4142 domain-containing protein n=1 Tax=Streptosporangium fragile TaxID=46186 RepID=A0ABN3W9B3_9ACTN
MARKMITLLAVIVMLGGTAGAVTPPPALNRQDKVFLARAHQGNLAEIEAGRAAQEKTVGQEVRESGEIVRELGMKLVVDHVKLDADLRRVAGQLGVELPDGPSGEQRRQLDEVLAKSGVEFDQAWLAAQIAAHRQTLAEGRRELQKGSSPEVKQLAADAAPVVREHLDLLLKAQRGESPSPAVTVVPSPSES